MRRHLWNLSAALAAVLLLTGYSLHLRAQGAAAPTRATAQASSNSDWRSYGANTSNNRYSSLDQINAGNFNQLQVAWRFKTDNLGPRKEFNLEGTPLVANGVLYSTAGTRKSVIALDAETGELLWVHNLPEGRRAEISPRQLSGRGLAYWTDGRDERIFYVTVGYQLIALDAKTGARLAGFGDKGVVDLKKDNDQDIDAMSGEIGYHAAPVVARNLVIVGAAHPSGGAPKSRANIKGHTRAFDVRTGKRVWIFHTVPDVGEFGSDTWLKDSLSYTGNNPVWGQISVDEELGLAYLPVGTPTSDYYGGNRPGNNLFAETLVAVDLNTGRRKWHYQVVHHPLWDLDLPSAPILIDITVNGRPIKAVAMPSKQNFLYVFNRETGEPIWPIEERPVPAGDTPGEWYAPTQPHPTKPAPFGRQGASQDDLVDFTPELRAQAIRLTEKYKFGPVFTPPVVSKAEGPIQTLYYHRSGGASWQGGSFDPETHRLYVSIQQIITGLSVTPSVPGTTDLQFTEGNVVAGARRITGNTGAAAPAAPAPVAPRPAPAAPAGDTAGVGRALNVQGLPLGKPPYGQITAYNMDTGEIIWQKPHGETPDNIKNHPALKGLTIPRTGQPGIAGTLVTKTLLIAGEPTFTTTAEGRGAMLRAYDKATGADAGAVYMPAPETGSSMTYMVNGRQYIVIAVGGGTYSSEFIAYALPRTR
jgi:quinoprotein glucose dehydrogenase